jgi:hypothetical protein
MAEQQAPQMQAMLGLTGLTGNATGLIAPGAFLACLLRLGNDRIGGSGRWHRHIEGVSPRVGRFLTVGHLRRH